MSLASVLEITNIAVVSPLLEENIMPSFLIITAFKEEYSVEENKSKTAELLVDLRSHKLGGKAYIGKYRDNNPNNTPVNQTYFFMIHSRVSDISAQELPNYLSRLCEKYQQEYCIYCNGNNVYRISNKGDIHQICSVEDLDARLGKTDWGYLYFGMELSKFNKILTHLKKRDVEVHSVLSPCSTINAMLLGRYGLYGYKAGFRIK